MSPQGPTYAIKLSHLANIALPGSLLALRDTWGGCVGQPAFSWAPPCRLWSRKKHYKTRLLIIKKGISAICFEGRERQRMRARIEVLDTTKK